LSSIERYVGKVISIEVVGGRYHEGMLIDFGPDIMVIFDSKNCYYYIPLAHLKHLRLSPQDGLEREDSFQNIIINSGTGLLSFRNILEKAKDILVKLFVTGNNSVYGYITDVLSDYVLFNSPVYKTMAININHIKWLGLTEQNQTFYSKGRKELQVQDTLNATAALTFEQQLNKLVGEIVVFDMGMELNRIGLVVSINGDFIELISANEETHLLNINHIKMFHS